MKARRLLSLLLAVLMITALLPASAMAAGGTVTVKETAAIGGRSVKVTLKGVQEGTGLKVSGVKKESWEAAVSAKMKSGYKTVLAVNVKASPALKKEASVVITAAALKGLKASGLRVFRVADGQGKEIRVFSLKDKDLRFKTKALGVIVIVQPLAEEAEEPAEEPAEELAEEPAEELAEEPAEEPAEELAEEPEEEPEEPAEEPETTPEPTPEPLEEQEAGLPVNGEDPPEVYTGVCGGNGSVMFDLTDGLLQIYGIGAMDDFHGTDTPWYEYREKIETVSINNGVTGIGSCAFYNCYNLREISIYDSVLSIGDCAFQWCYKLTSIFIPASVSHIGMLTRYSNIYEIIVDSKNPYYSSKDGVLFNADKTELIEYPEDKGGSYTVPNTVKTIRSNAFHLSGLTRITIPEGVETIGYGAFDSATDLVKVIIPASVTECSSMFGSGLYIQGLTSAGPAGSGCSIEYGWTKKIPADAFYGLSHLTEFNLPASIEDPGSYRIDTLEKITVEEGGKHYSSVDGVLLNGDKTTVIYCPPKKTGSFVIPSGVRTIADSAFESCDNLTNITIPDTVQTIGNSAFSGCEGLAGLTIPSAVQTIGNYAFASCELMLDATLPGTLTSLGEGAFNGCIGLTRAVVPGTISTIGEYTFIGCESLEVVTIQHGVTTIRSCAFESCRSLATISIPSSVRHIEALAFDECSSLADVWLSGTPFDYAGIEIESWNSCLQGAYLHYSKYQLTWENWTDDEQGGKVVFYVNGAVSELAAPGQRVSFTVVPDSGWELKSLSAYVAQPNIGPGNRYVVDDLEYTRDSGSVGSYTFTLPGDCVNAKINVTFREIPTTDYSYKITFNKNASAATGTMSALTGKLSEEKSLPANKFTYTGKQFVGWNTKADGSGTAYANGESVRNIVTKNNQKITLYAQWKVKTYPVVYVANGGTGEPPIQYKKYDIALTLSKVKPTREGFKFLGWATSLKEANSGKYTYKAGAKNTYTKNARLTLFAVWKEITYTITYDANGGTGAPAKQTKYYTKDRPLRGAGNTSRTGYTLIGWYDKANGIEYPLNGTYTENKDATLYAIWKPVHYTILFKGAGAENTMEPIEAVYGRSYTVTSSFVRTGYTINAKAAWKCSSNKKTYADGAKVKNLTAEDGDAVVLTAQWTPNKYKVKFAPGTVAVGTVSGKMSTVTFTYGKKETLPAVGFKAKGYDFAGWTAGGEERYFETALNLATKGTVTLTATWTPIKYKITYKLNKGTNPEDAPKIHTIEDGKITLPTPTRKGYTFKGWFTDPKFAKDSRIKEIPAHSTKKYTVYAKWVKATTVDFILNSNPPGTSGKQNEEKKLTLSVDEKLPKDVFTVDNCFIMGWTVKSKWTDEEYAGLKCYPAEAAVKDLIPENGGTVTLYAQWLTFPMRDVTISQLYVPMAGGIVSYYEQNDEDYTWTHYGSTYRAVDMSAGGAVIGNTPIVAIADGRVVNSYGEDGSVYIKHTVPLRLSDGSKIYHTWYSVYAHMSNKQVKVGDLVKCGQQIGTYDSVGATGAHLHFSVTTKLYDNNGTPWDIHGQLTWGQSVETLKEYCGYTLSPKWLGGPFADVPYRKSEDDIADASALARINAPTSSAPESQ